MRLQIGDDSSIWPEPPFCTCSKDSDVTIDVHGHTNHKFALVKAIIYTY